MADIPVSSVTRDGKPRAKKIGFRLDMTPMVDLAFLLLTFFMLTTTFAKPTVMQMSMPAKGPTPDNQTPVPASRALTLILGEGGTVRYFFGLNEAVSNPAAPHPTLYTTDFSSEGLRQVLLNRQQKQPAPVVLIKTESRATYQSLVDALDEMNITNQKQYALVELSQADEVLLRDVQQYASSTK